jgi:hypothetical protein
VLVFITSVSQLTAANSSHTAGRHRMYHVLTRLDRLCGLVVRVPAYGSRRPGSIPGATRLSDKQWVWNGVHSAS